MKISFLSYFLAVLLFVPDIAVADLNPLLEKKIKYTAVQVEKVLSVDTILIKGDERVVLIGIEGPATPRRKDVKRDSHGFIIREDDPTTSFEEEALRSVRSMLEGVTVNLEFDVERRGEDNILQAYVYLPDGRMANCEILRQGFADLKLRSPNLKYADKMRDAYREARRDMKGLQGQW